MNNFPISIEDLSPRPTSFLVESRNEPIRLCRWSLRVRSWALSHFGAEKLSIIFKENRIVDMAEIAYYMLEDKKDFPTLDSFLEVISTPRDHLNFLTALLGTIGIGEPEIKKIAQAESGKPSEKKNQPRRKKTTGAKSLKR